jgi:hypothetical protein
MTTSAHLAITDDILAALRADPPLVDGPIVRGRAVVLTKAFTGAIGVRLVRSAGQPYSLNGDMQWQTLIAVECLKRADEGEDAHAAVDGLLQAVFERLGAACSAADAPLLPQGLGEMEIAWDFDEQDPSVGAASLALRAEQLTAANTLRPQT